MSLLHFTSDPQVFADCQCGLPHILREPMLEVLPDPMPTIWEEGGVDRPVLVCMPPNASDDATPEPLFMVRCMGDGSHLTRDGTLLGLGRVFSTERADFFTEAEALALGFPVPPVYVLIPVSDS